MKKILSLIAACSMLAVFNTHAEDAVYAPVTLVASGSATCAAISATNVSKLIDCRKQSTVALQISQMADATGAHTTRYIFAPSVDGTTFDNKALQAVDISFNGVTAQVIVTNIPSNGAGYLRLSVITNLTATINTTNIIVKYGLKIP